MGWKLKNLLLGIVVLQVLAGCALKWEPVLQEARYNNPSPESRRLLQQAKINFNQADDKESLQRSIEAYQQVLDVNPGDYEALVALSTQHILMGTAYTESRNKKSIFFHKAMRYAELAMYTNPEFKTLVDQGKTPWEAADTLGKNEIEAMFFWVTALQYEFKEGMNLAGKIRNVGWLNHGLVFLDRIEEVAPDFGGGAVEFSKVICYYALPQIFGGDREKGDEYMQKAVKRGENWLLPRWARGKYYYRIKDEDEKSRADLAWVVEQDLNKFKDPYPWRVHFQENARNLLN